MSYDSEPFDDYAYLALLDELERSLDGSGEATATSQLRFVHQSRKLHVEAVRLRNRERIARERLSLLEQGQTLLPLPAAQVPPSTTDNQPASIQP